MIDFVRRLKKIATCALALMKIPCSPYPTMRISDLYQLCQKNETVIYVFSINSRSTEPTGDTQDGCATSGGQSGLPGWLIAEPLTMPVDEAAEANRLIDQIIDLQKTLDDLTSKMNGAWKFLPSGLVKNTLLK